MSRKVLKITLHWEMARRSAWPSQRVSAGAGQRTTTGHIKHTQITTIAFCQYFNHLAHSSEGCNMGHAQLGRWSILRGAAQAHSHICSLMGLAGAAWVQWPCSHVWWYELAVSWTFPSTWLSSSRKLPRASLHKNEVSQESMA